MATAWSRFTTQAKSIRCDWRTLCCSIGWGNILGNYDSGDSFGPGKGGKEDRRILVLLGGRRPMVRGRQARKEADSHLSQRAAIC